MFICETLPDVLERGRGASIGDEKMLLLFSELWDFTMASWRPMRIVLLRTYLRRLCYGKRYVWPWSLTGLVMLFFFATLLFCADLDVRREWCRAVIRKVKSARHTFLLFVYALCRAFHTKVYVTSPPSYEWMRHGITFGMYPITVSIVITRLMTLP